MPYVIQEFADDRVWEEVPIKSPTLDHAIERVDFDVITQIVRIPQGKIVWRRAP